MTVNTGAHGQEEGLGTHWELWSFVRGGWTPLEALRAATINPARHLGMDADIGSLEKGKLADLVILDADPLEDIRNSDKISGVMLNGRLYDPVTMNEVTTGNAVRAPLLLGALRPLTAASRSRAGRCQSQNPQRGWRDRKSVV